MRKLLAEIGREVDARAKAAGLSLTSGGELTFTLPCTLDPQWRSEPLGDDKRERAQKLAAGLARRVSGEVAPIPGRKYEGEDEPRWCLRVSNGNAELDTTVTPDPGVVEVNLAPARTVAALMKSVIATYDAAEEAGLAAHRLLHNGRVLGSGGGAHVTLGGPTLAACPFAKVPRLLGDLAAFAHAHPSLSYAFVGLGAGPTSQAPRADESGVDRVRDLAAAVATLRESTNLRLDQVHAILQPVLSDLTGNTHRAELNVEKIPALGVLELRAVEAPPRAEMWLAVSILFRAIAVALAERSRAPRGKRPEAVEPWGDRLHDEWLLPSVMRRDLAEVAKQAGVPGDLVDACLEHRYGALGVLEAPGVRCTVRQALEPWPVLGALARQEASGSRLMDSSTDRIEVTLTGPRAARTSVVVAGRTVPRVRRGTAWVGGVRWRAIPGSAGGLQPLAPVYAPLEIALVDRQTGAVLALARYHPWSPDGLAYDGFPRDLDDAAARRAARFEVVPVPRKTAPRRAASAPDGTPTLDLVRLP